MLTTDKEKKHHSSEIEHPKNSKETVLKTNIILHKNKNSQKLKKGTEKQSKIKQRKIEVNPELEGLDRLQEEIKLSFHLLIKRIINKILKFLSNFFEKILPNIIANYKRNKKAKKEREEITKKLCK